MKKMSLAAIGVTGALILTTAATALAAPSVEKEQANNDTQTILSSSTAKSAPTELPEKFRDLELPEGITLPDNKEETNKEETDPVSPEKPENEDEKPFTKGSRFKSSFVPKLRPETKPVGDNVPPEFEGIENIDQLGRPEFSEEGRTEDMSGESAHGKQFDGEMPEDMQGEFDGQRGESKGRHDFRGESAPDEQFNGEMPEDMQGKFNGQHGEFEEMPDEFDGQRGESEGQPNFRGESAPDEPSGNEVAL